jgi:hypothetical protein
VETPAGDLTLTGNSSDQALVPDANIDFGGSGENRTLTVTPAAGKTGTATITVGVSDGNAEASDTFALTVQDTTAPTVTNVAPTGTKVSPKTSVTATFSEAMNETSVEAGGTFTLKKGTKEIPATVAYDPNTKTATLDPSVRKLRSGATYTVTATTGARDLAGNALAANKVWKFRIR